MNQRKKHAIRCRLKQIMSQDSLGARMPAQKLATVSVWLHLVSFLRTYSVSVPECEAMVGTSCCTDRFESDQRLRHQCTGNGDLHGPIGGQSIG